MIIYRLVKYLKYIFISGDRKGHGIHSPFVFDLVSRIFRNKIDPVIVFTIEQVRKKMTSDKQIISVRDLGLGGVLLKNRSEKVSDIVRKSPVTAKYGAFLSRMANEFGKPLIIEMGTSFGISTMYMAASCNDATVITIEGSAEIARIARENFSKAGLKNITVLEGSFDDILSDIDLKSVKPGLVFIDGDHRKEAVIHNFNRVVEFSDSKTVIIIDDINHSKEMAEAWKEIKLNKKVSLTVDIFRMGICFFREGINHNNYIIRY